MSQARSNTSYWLVGGLSLALLLLATLQYQWIGQVSDAERARMRTNLQIAVSQFRQDFSRELSGLCSGFQADPETVEQRDWNRLARQGLDGLRNNPEAGLVAAVYLWDAEKDTVLELNRTAQRFETAASAGAIYPVLQQFREQTADGPQGRFFRGATWNLETRVPALVHSVFVFPEPGERARPHLAGFIAIAMNASYLQQKFLPELASRHFAASDRFLYNVGILRVDDPEHPVYRSDGFLPTSFGTADVNVSMLEQRPRGPERPGAGGFGLGPGPRAEHGQPGPAEQARGRGEGIGRDDDRQRDRYHFGARLASVPPTLGMPDAQHQWRLVARHRAGSVDAAVEQVRWRDLGVSFAILMLLGASMALIVVSTHRAQRLARLQMEFVAGISHELRTPLTVISSAAQNLTDGIVEGKPQVKLYGTLIRNESRRLSGMMEQILQFASGQKKRAYEPAPLAPADLIENALGLASSMIDEAGTNVERQIAPDLPQVMGESGALVQCLHNLIANAVKYGGEARWLRVRAWAEENFVRIAVEDRGIGIDSTDLPHIFEAFYRSRTVTSAQIHGTGLGLSLARNFAEEAGGSISVESAPGHGSTFVLRLPARAAAAKEPVRLSERTA